MLHSKYSLRLHPKWWQELLQGGEGETGNGDGQRGFWALLVMPVIFFFTWRNITHVLFMKLQNNVGNLGMPTSVAISHRPPVRTKTGEAGLRASGTGRRQDQWQRVPKVSHDSPVDRASGEQPCSKPAQDVLASEATWTCHQPRSMGFRERTTEQAPWLQIFPSPAVWCWGS